MSLNINSIVSFYTAFLAAGTSYGTALSAYAAQADCDSDALFAALAPVHAKKFNCNFSIAKTGKPVFHTGAECTRETRVGAAAVSWSRNVQVHFTMTDAKPKAAQDPVAALLKAYAKLSNKDAKRFWAAFEA